jgi:two-component system OmpR family sensor kinase
MRWRPSISQFRSWLSRMGVRDRLLMVVLCTVAIALVTMTVTFNVLLGVLLASDVDERLSSLVTDTSRSLRVEGGVISLPRPAGDIKELGSQIWVFAQGKTVSTPAVDPEIEAAAKALQDQPYTYVDVPGHDVRLLGEPLMDGKDIAKRIGTIVAGLDMGSYVRVQKMALLGTVSFTALMLLVVGLVGQWALNAAFRPVSQMTAEAEAWSTSDLDKRFEMGDPHDELTQLAHTLDALLDRLAASLRRERRFSAEISHQLRTPVAKIKAEAELALRRERDSDYYQESLRSVVHSADQMARTVETLLAAAQEEASLAKGRAEVAEVLNDVSVSVEVLARENGVDVDAATPAKSLCVGVGVDIAAQIVRPVVENACRFARSRVSLGAERKGKEVRFVIEDDGPGVSEDEKDKIFEPGVRGSAAGRRPEGARGAGLGLSLARRLARAASGDVELEPSASGARFVIRLPSG